MNTNTLNRLQRISPDAPPAQATALLPLVLDLVASGMSTAELIALDSCRPGWHCPAVRLTPLPRAGFALFPLILDGAAHPWEDYAAAGSWLNLELLRTPDACAHLEAPLRAAHLLAQERNTLVVAR